MRRISIAIALLATSTTAVAQDRGDSRRSARDLENEVVREVVRGYYMKANMGTVMYLGAYSTYQSSAGVVAPLVKPVMALSLGVGSDFLDKERLSAAWEVQFGQSLLNGPRYEELPFLAANQLTQGDMHTFKGTVGVEVSTYLTRRFGLGMRAGGGIMMIPLLLDPGYYQTEVVEAIWGVPAGLHEGPLPTVFGGPTIEYYTKLSHFSIGADVDVTYTIGFDLGVEPSGYLKYTF